jgi:hypothetical protein
MRLASLFLLLGMGIISLSQSIMSFDPMKASDSELAEKGLPGHNDKFWDRYSKNKDRLQYLQPEFIFNDAPISTPNVGSNKAGTETYTNWSGGVIYAAPGTGFQSVTGEWVVPDVKPATQSNWEYHVNWIGIDGDGSPDVLQAGVISESYWSTNGSYLNDLLFWHEWYPQGLVVVSNFAFRAGDLISMTITSTGPGATSATINVLNATTGVYTSYTITAPTGTHLVGNSAEWIAEVPTVSGKIGTMPDYGQIFFSQAQATQSDGTVVNGGTGNNINIVQNNVMLSQGTLITPTIIQAQYVGPLP